MQNNPSTDHTDNIDNQTRPFDMEREDWEIAFEPFEGHAYAALRMGFNLATIRKDLNGLLIKSRPVMETLDLAMEALYPYIRTFTKHPSICF